MSHGSQTHRPLDPVEHEIETALAPGGFIAWDEGDDFVADVRAVRDEIAGFTEAGNPARALPLLESFIAACQAKMEEVDDSDGCFGHFAGELPLDWVRARQAAGRDAEETVATLARWSAADEYGIYDDIVVACVPLLDEPGLAALEGAARQQLAADDGTSRRYGPIATLEAIHESRGDTAAYEALATHTGGPSSRQCKVLARMHLAAGDDETALAWVDRALAPSGDAGTTRHATRSFPDHELPGLRRDILARLGRSQEAAESAWHDYHENPDVQSLEELLRYVRDADRTSWHTRAMDTLHTAPLDAALRILTHERESERLATVVEKADRRALVGISHRAIEPAAELLAAAHPHAAAQLRIAAALRIVEPGKSPYYAAAHRHLGHARELLLAAGHEKEWEDLVSAIRTAHRRKYSFMPRFEEIVAGRRPVQQPTFLDRARAAWQRRTDRLTGE